MKNRTILAMALAGVISIDSAFGQNEEVMPFVRIDRNPVSAGMGFAGVAADREIAYSSFRNSSVIPLSTERMSFGVSGESWALYGEKSSNINFGGAARVGKRFGLSIGATYQTGEDYSLTSDNGVTKGTFKPNEIVINGGVGFLITDNLSAGANVRFASQKLSEENSYSAIAADIFMTYRLNDLNITAGVSNMGSSVKSEDGASFNLPTSATVGAAWSKSFSAVHGVRLAADVDYFFSRNVTAAAGVEYSFKNMFFARTGYHFGTKDAVLPSFATVGLGVRIFGISLNVAYLTANDIIDNTITFGLGYHF